MYFYYRYKNFVFGSLIITLFFSQLLIWLNQDHTPVTWDPAYHLTNSLRYFNLFHHPSINLLKSIIISNRLYPPFVGLSLLPFYSLFGESADKAIFYQNLIYVPLLLITTYLIAKRLNHHTGVLPLFLLLTYPQIYTITTQFFLEMPLAAMVSLSIYGLICTENFTRPKNSVFLGIMLGMGMLTKIQFSIFLLGPFLILAFFSLKDGYTAGTLIKRSINIIIPLLTALLISSFWYFPEFKKVVSSSINAAIEVGVFRGDPFPLSPQSLLYYIFSLINKQISFVYIVLFLIGLIFFLKKITRERILIISWIVIPYIILTFLIYQKQDRFILPSLPAFAIITSIGLSEVSKKYFKLFVIPTITIALLQFLAINFGINFVYKDFKIPLFADRNLILFRNVESQNTPKSKAWGLEKSLYAIYQDMQGNGEFKSKILVFANIGVYNYVTLNYYSLSNNLNLEIKIPKGRVLNKRYLRDLFENDSNRYFIFKTWPNNCSPEQKMIYVNGIRFVYSHPESFQRIFTQKNPDSSFTFIYKRVLPIKTYQNEEKLLKLLISPIKIKSLSFDSPHLIINFEGGIPPYGIEIYPLQNPEKHYFIGIGDKRSYTWIIGTTVLDIIRKQGGIAIKVLDVIGNESNEHICQIN